MKIKKFFTIILSVIIIIAGFGIVIAFDTVKAKMNQTEVIVAAKDIGFKEKITREHLSVIDTPSEQVLEGSFAPSQLDEIVGGYAAIDIPKGQQMNATILDSFDLIPNEEDGEFIAPIPEEWLFTVPQSLRKSYLADFYIVPTDEKKMVASMTSGEQEQFLTNDREPLLQNIRISSVKNSSNAEVETVVNEDESEAATGTISNIEVIANDKILDALRSSSENGYALYVVYTLEREGNEDKEVIINEEGIKTLNQNGNSNKTKGDEDNQSTEEGEND